jgi:hypothetical protein
VNQAQKTGRFAWIIYSSLRCLSLEDVYSRILQALGEHRVALSIHDPPDRKANGLVGVFRQLSRCPF